MKMCERCTTAATATPGSKYCLPCKKIVQEENGRAGGKKAVAMGHGRINVPRRAEE